VAAVYAALAELLRVVGTDRFTARRQALTSALKPVTEAVRALLGVLGSGERLSAHG
jgi:hypothetical protein